jgi:hypothetical protein
MTWPSPAYGVPSGGCSNCAPGFHPGCSDPCPCEKTGLFAKFKNRGGCDCSPADSKKKKHGIFHGFTTSGSCDSCDGGRGGLFSHLHSRMGHGGGDCGCSDGGSSAPAWGGPTWGGGCGLPAVPGPVTAPAAPAPTEVPRPMEKAKEPAKSGNGAGSARLPAPAPVLQTVPVLSGTKSPF